MCIPPLNVLLYYLDSTIIRLGNKKVKKKMGMLCFLIFDAIIETGIYGNRRKGNEDL